MRPEELIHNVAGPGELLIERQIEWHVPDNGSWPGEALGGVVISPGPSALQILRTEVFAADMASPSYSLRIPEPRFGRDREHLVNAAPVQIHDLELLQDHAKRLVNAALAHQELLMATFANRSKDPRFATRLQ